MPLAGQPGHRVYDDPASSPCNEFLNGERNRRGTVNQHAARDDADDYFLLSHGVLALNRAQNDRDWNIFCPIGEGSDLFSKVVLLIEGEINRVLKERGTRIETEDKRHRSQRITGIELQAEELS